jgi:hypothetical protein
MAGFFDSFFVGTAVLVAILTATDWLIGPKLREKLREKVGDFWTILQYTTLDAIFVSSLSPVARFATVIYGCGARRLFIASFMTNAIIIFPMFLFALRSGIFEGAYANRVMLVAALSVAAIGWLPWSFLAETLKGICQKRPRWYEILVAFARVVGRALMFSLTYFVVFIVFSVVVSMAVAALAPDGPLEPWMECDDLDFGPIGCGLRVGTMIVLIALFISMLALAAVLLPLIAMGVLLIGLLLLKMARPAIQPPTTLLLQRLYESKQGVLTQIATGAGLVAKFAQELAKHLQASV